MANKKTLDELIMEVLSLDDFGSMFGTSVPSTDKEVSGLVDKTIGFERAFDMLKPFDDDKATLSIKDLKHLVDNPQDITTDIQAALISIVKKNGAISTDSDVITQQIANLKKEIEESSSYLIPFVEYFNLIEKEQKKLSPGNLGLFKKKYDFRSNPMGQDLIEKRFLEKIITSYYAINLNEKSKQATSVMVDGKWAGMKGKSGKLLVEKEIYLLNAKISPKKVTIDKKVKTFLERYHKLDPKQLVKTYASDYNKKYNQLVGALDFRSEKDKVREFNKYAKKAQEALSALEQAIKATAGREQSITDPQIKSQRSNVGLKEPTYILKAIENLGLSGNIKTKIDQISKISKKYYDAAKGESPGMEELRDTAQKDLPKMLAEVAILDMFNSMSKEFDSGSGAYLFEYMLATITGGQVLGKEKTDAGKMGAADFIDGDGNPGSAKYYGKGEGLTQSIKGFKDRYDKSGEKVEIRYVIGVKKQGAEQISTDEDPKRRRGTSDPSRLMAIEIFTPMISYEEKDGNAIVKIDDVRIKQSGTEIVISKHLKKSSGVLYMATGRTETFREMIDSAFGEKEEDSKKLASKVYAFFKTYLGEIKNARELGQEYTQTGNVDKATQAHTALNTSQKSLKSLAEKMFDHERSASKYAAKQPKLDLSENKSLKKLDKLIEQVILEHINK
jgi:hypothetical protein